MRQPAAVNIMLINVSADFLWRVRITEESVSHRDIRVKNRLICVTHSLMQITYIMFAALSFILCLSQCVIGQQ